MIKREFETEYELTAGQCTELSAVLHQLAAAKVLPPWTRFVADVLHEGGKAGGAIVGEPALHPDVSSEE